MLLASDIAWLTQGQSGTLRHQCDFTNGHVMCRVVEPLQPIAQALTYPAPSLLWMLPLVAVASNAQRVTSALQQLACVCLAHTSTCTGQLFRTYSLMRNAC